jgi:hypothetical protein
MRTDRIIYAALWLGLIGYAVFLAPPSTPGLLAEIGALATADTARVDPIAVAIFNLLGVLPTAFLAILVLETGRPRAWPFAVGAYFLGGMILLPYLVMRNTDAPLNRHPGRVSGAISSRIAGSVLFAIALGLVGFGLIFGDVAAFAEQFSRSKFIAIMSADLLALTLALHLAAATDRRRRGLGEIGAWRHLPLFGPLLYLSSRPWLDGSRGVGGG